MKMSDMSPEYNLLDKEIKAMKRAIKKKNFFRIALKAMKRDIEKKEGQLARMAAEAQRQEDTVIVSVVVTDTGVEKEYEW